MVKSSESYQNSLWWHTAREMAPGAPSLLGNLETSVFVVGGGFSGLSAALYLAEHGIDVVLAEARHIGFGASGRNGGQVIPGLKYDPDDLVAAYGEKVGGALTELAAGAADLVFETIEKYAIECSAARSGWIQAAHSRKALAAVQHRARHWQARGVDAEILDRDAIADRVGSDAYHGGWLDPRAGGIQPLEYARGLARAAVASGVRLFEHSPVRSLRKRGGVWIGELDQGRVQAQKVLVLTNAYTNGLVPGLAQTVLPVQSMQVATEPLPDSLAATLLKQRVVVSETRKLAFYFRLAQDNRLIIGGRGAVGDTENGRLFDALEFGLYHIFPQLRGSRIEHRWSGQLALTMDGLPHLHVGEDGLFTALGYNGRGIAMATALGFALGRHLGGGVPLAFPVSPIRRLPWHGIRKPIMNMGVRWYWLKDRLGYPS